MTRVLKSPTARQDAAQIWKHIAADNPDAATQLLHDFDTRLSQLSHSPEAGRLREEFAPRLRSVPVGSYVLFYLPLHDGVELIRIIHGARDIHRFFR